MSLKKNDLLNLPVYTQSGQHLGRICDFEFDPVAQAVVKYYVRSTGLIKELLHKELLINREQVVSISPEKMVVDDGVIPAGEAKKAPSSEAVPAD
jgi:sporulation protein YlmC with PRC-barrel domain